MKGKKLLRRIVSILLSIVISVPTSILLMPTKAVNASSIEYDISFIGNASEKYVVVKGTTVWSSVYGGYTYTYSDYKNKSGLWQYMQYASYTAEDSANGQEYTWTKQLWYLEDYTDDCYIKYANALVCKTTGAKYDIFLYPARATGSYSETRQPAGKNHRNYLSMCIGCRRDKNRVTGEGGKKGYSRYKVKVCTHTSGTGVGSPVTINNCLFGIADLDGTEGFSVRGTYRLINSWKQQLYSTRWKTKVTYGKNITQSTYEGYPIYIGTSSSDSLRTQYCEAAVMGFTSIPASGLEFYTCGSEGLGESIRTEEMFEPDMMHVLTVKPNEGTWNGFTQDSKLVDYEDSKYDISDPTRSGYRFIGWTKSGGGTWNSSSKIYTFGTSDGVLQANWEIIPGTTPTPTTPPPHTPVITDETETSYSSQDYYYYVYYYSNGGSGSVASQSARYKHVDYTTVTTIQYEDGVEVGRSSTTTPVTTYYTPSVTLRSNTFSPPYGYSKASGWSTSSGYYPSKGYWDNGVTPSPVNGYSYSEGQSVTLSGNLYLYARWMPNQHQVTYHRNHAAGTVYGTPNPATVYFRQAIDVGTNKYYATRTGWTFMGWSWSTNSTSVLSPTVYLDTDYDRVLYAIYNRSLNLILAADKLENKAQQSFPMTIYTHTSAFNYNSSSFTNATTRTKGTYTVTFGSNGSSRNIGLGNVKDSENREIATDLTNNKITVTRWFNGWYPDETSGYQADTSSTKVGTSGTTVTVTPYEYTAHNYNVAGNAGNYDRTYNNDTITLYPIYNKTYLKLPDSRRNEDKGANAAHGGNETDGNEEDLFLGWFTKPQPDDGGTGDGGIYYGKAGDVVEIKQNVTLYPWFNIAPTIIRSAIGEDLNGTTPDGVKKGFYEGQPVSYPQMMSLIDASDTDNPKEIGPEGLVQYSGVNVWTTLLRLNVVSFLHDTYPDMTAAEIDEIEKMTNYECFIPKLVDVEFKCNGKDSKGNNVSDGVLRRQTVNGSDTAMLDTRQQCVGDVILHYQITDNGTFANGVQILTGRTSPGGKVYTIDSPITVDFLLDTVIHFNDLPRIETCSTPLYTKDESITSSTITKFLLDKQNAIDRQDDYDYKPWWYRAETSPALDDTLSIVRVYDIKFDSGYQNEHPDECAEVARITNIIDLFKLKDDNRDVFHHIKSFMVEVDCYDQWGKHASGYYGNDHGIDGSYDETSKKADGSVDPIGMKPEERSFVVTMFNDWDDYDLMLANTVVAERIRYIDPYWSEYLSGNSYWGTFSYGKSKLEEIFALYRERGPSETYTGTMPDGTPLTINDYTTD